MREDMNKKVADLEQIKHILGSLQNTIKTEFKAEIAGVFGSYARGEQKEGSDLDVLVKFYEGVTLFDFMGLADYLESKLDLKVDIVSERAVRPETKKEIYREFVRL